MNFAQYTLPPAPTNYEPSRTIPNNITDTHEKQDGETGNQDKKKKKKCLEKTNKNRGIRS